MVDADSIVDYKEVEGAQVPLTSLEDWYFLYQLMPNREVKVALIETDLKKNGIKHTALLKRMIHQDIPVEVSGRVDVFSRE